MIKKNKMKGFTLVELLAVIVILAIILVIAVPKVMEVINDSKKATLESTAKMIASAAEKAKVQNTILGKTDTITCESVAKINDLDYEYCDIDFDDNKALVTIKGSGKFAGLNVCSGTKTGAEATNDECSIAGETVGCDTLYWDGNTEGLERYTDVPFYKVSNIAPNVGDFANGGTVKMIYNGEEMEVEISDVQSDEFANIIFAFGAGVIITVPNTLESDGITVSSGTYFGKDTSFYVAGLKINGYTGFPHSENCGH